MEIAEIYSHHAFLRKFREITTLSAKLHTLYAVFTNFLYESKFLIFPNCGDYDHSFSSSKLLYFQS